MGITISLPIDIVIALMEHYIKFLENKWEVNNETT